MDTSISIGLPRYVEIRADDHWQAIDFVSDLHLAEGMPRTFAAFRRYLETTPADAVLILGDLFEVWVGDDAGTEGFEAEVLESIARAACCRRIGFMAGNRDFLVGTETLRRSGMFGLSDPTVLEAFGRRALLTHGDRLCLGDVDYQRFREQVRSTAWQADFLARPLEERRAIARDLRDRSRERAAGRAREEWYDVDTASAVRWMHEAGARVLVHGHTHQPGTDPLAPGYLRHVLSDWDLEDGDPGRAEVLRWTASGFARLGLAQAAAAIAPSP
ncbi:MAG: UDP-2,3-diacylglucosamine diphosphatase [Ideonella sp.]|jgi:UDP-2,3-diacylglucosamine hydrolase|nr:UDP-2,3-diacylglucosamine diphosphatase [Ideonella sp.]